MCSLWPTEPDSYHIMWPSTALLNAVLESDTQGYDLISSFLSARRLSALFIVLHFYFCSAQFNRCDRCDQALRPDLCDMWLSTDLWLWSPYKTKSIRLVIGGSFLGKVSTFILVGLTSVLFVVFCCFCYVTGTR